MPDNVHTKFLLNEDEMPRSWYNIVADLPNPPAPVLHPGTHQPVGPADLAPLFPMALIMQEVSTERYIDIPEPIRQVYTQWRPSPLYRARRLEKALDTPARIYYKYEGVSPAGSHKPNTAVAQAFYNKEEGVKKLSTETGAGQWGCRHRADRSGSSRRGAGTGHCSPTTSLRPGSRECRARAAALATRNVKDFMETGVDVVDPWQPR